MISQNEDEEGQHREDNTRIVANIAVSTASDFIRRDSMSAP